MDEQKETSAMVMQYSYSTNAACFARMTEG